MISFLSIDQGFDARVNNILIYLPLSLREINEIKHHPKGNTKEVVISRGNLFEVAESLANSGYSVVVLQTSNGRDIQCTPREGAPKGKESDEQWSGATWAVQARYDNYWCIGPILQSALSQAGWSEQHFLELGSEFFREPI